MSLLPLPSNVLDPGMALGSHRDGAKAEPLPPGIALAGLAVSIPAATGFNDAVEA